MVKTVSVVWLLLTWLGACAHPVSRWQGVVIHVSDGDTVWVQPVSGEAPHKIRLIGIDAPELCQTWGVPAREALRQLVWQHTVQVTVYAHDSYGRELAKLHLAGLDVGGWLVSQGHAWVSHGSRRRGTYLAYQAQAQALQLGLFAQPEALLPNRFRKQHGPCRPF